MIEQIWRAYFELYSFLVEWMTVWTSPLTARVAARYTIADLYALAAKGYVTRYSIPYEAMELALGYAAKFHDGELSVDQGWPQERHPDMDEQMVDNLATVWAVCWAISTSGHECEQFRSHIVASLRLQVPTALSPVAAVSRLNEDGEVTHMMKLAYDSYVRNMHADCMILKAASDLEDRERTSGRNWLKWISTRERVESWQEWPKSSSS